MAALWFRMSVFLWLSVALLGGPMMVVCSAADGHVAVEVAHGDGCDKGADRSPHASFDQQTAPCDDLPIFDAPARVESRADLIELPPAVELLFASTLCAGVPHDGAALPEPVSHRPPSHLTPLASTVLRI